METPTQPDGGAHWCKASVYSWSEAVAVPDTTGSSQAEVFEGQLALGERQAHIQLLQLSYDKFRAGCPWATAPTLKGLL